jgi:hypothetical protein
VARSRGRPSAARRKAAATSPRRSTGAIALSSSNPALTSARRPARPSSSLSTP